MKTFLERLTVLVLLAGTPTGAARAGEPPRPAEAGGLHELGRLWTGLARYDTDQLRAAHRYLHAARAFQRAGEEEFRKALTAGVLAARPLRATWVQQGRIVAMTFLPGDRQFLTVDTAGDVRVLDTATGKQVRSFPLGVKPWPADIVSGAVFSRDRSRLLVWASVDVLLWDLTAGKQLHAWRRILDLRGAAVLHGDRHVLIWEGNRPTRLYDVRTGAELRHYDDGRIWGYQRNLSRDRTHLLTGVTRPGHGCCLLYLYDLARPEPVRDFAAESDRDNLWAAFAPDGAMLLVYGYADGSARLHTTATGRRVASFPAKPRRRANARVEGAVFSPDGRRLLTWDYDRVRLWDLADGEVVGTFVGSHGHAAASFSPDGKYVLVFGDPCTLWDAADGGLLGRLGTNGAATFTKDGRRVLLWSQGRAELWRLKDQQLLRAFGPAAAAEVAFSGDENLLLVYTVTNDGKDAIRLWDLRQLERSAPAYPPETPAARAVFRHPAAVLTAALDRQQRRLLTCDAGGTARLWDVATGKEVRSFRHGPGVRGAGFDPAEARVLTWGEGGLARLWDVGSGRELLTLHDPADLGGAAFAADGRHLLTWDDDYTARWWDLSTGKAPYRFEHPRDLFGARLDVRGTRALTWGLDGTARLWDLGTGRLVHALVHDGPVFAAAFTREPGRVWTWTGDALHEWDVGTGKERRHLRLPQGVAAAEPDRDGKHFLATGAQGLVRYVDAGSGKVLATFSHAFNVYGYYESLAGGRLSPDATRAVTWAGDGSVNVWDVASGLELFGFRHDKAVAGAAFTPDGGRLLTWAADGTARLWDTSFPRVLAPDDQLLELEVRSGLRVDELGNVQALSFDEWQARRKKLEKVMRKE